MTGIISLCDKDVTLLMKIRTILDEYKGSSIDADEFTEFLEYTYANLFVINPQCKKPFDWRRIMILLNPGDSKKNAECFENYLIRCGIEEENLNEYRRAHHD